MGEHAVTVRAIDFSDPADLRSYLAMLDAYANDPMGASAPLQADARERLVRDLPTHPTVEGLLAEHGDTAVGFATCFVGYSTFRARPLLNIHDIAVLHAWRGRAVADALLDAVTARARQLGCCRVTLEVRDDNAPARRVYARNGFVSSTCNLFLEKSL